MTEKLLDRGHANAKLVLPGRECAPPCMTARIDARCAVDGLEPRAERDRAHVLARTRARDQGRCVGQFL